MLVADAVLNGAAGLNIWSGGGVSRPQRSARLYRALVDGGLASSVSGGLMPTEHPYLYSLSVSVAEGKSLAAVEEVVLKEVDRLQRDGITPAEFAKVNAQLRARFVYDGDSVTDIAHQLGYFETIGSWRNYHDLRARLDAVTPEAVHAAAVKYLTPANRTIGWFEPIRDSGIKAWGLGQVSHGLESDATRARQRRHRDREGESHHAGREPADRRARRRLLRIRPIAKAPPRLCARVLDRGTVTRPADVIADDLDGRGASLSVVTGRHQMAISATCLSDDFGAVLTLAADIARHPAFPDAEVTTRRADLITSIRQDEDNPAPMAVDAFARALYGSHPYARKVRGSVASVEAHSPPGPGAVLPEGLPAARHHRGRGRRCRGGRGHRGRSARCSATGRRPTRRLEVPAAGARCGRARGAPARDGADDEQGAGRPGLWLRRHSPRRIPTTPRSR